MARKRRSRRPGREVRRSAARAREPASNEPAERAAAAAGSGESAVLAWALPAIVAGLVFAGTLGNEPTYDDRWTLKRIPPLSLSSAVDALQRNRGLTYLVHSLDRWLWGSWSPGYHLTNVVLHALASALAGRAALALTSSRRAAVLCGLVFAVHPVHTEVVASFAYRKDSLATIFVLLALVVWLGADRPVLRYAATTACLVAGLLAKEVVAVGLVPMLFLADLLPGHGRLVAARDRLARALRRSLPLVVLGSAAALWFLDGATADTLGQSIDHQSNGVVARYRDVLATTVAAVPDVGRLLVMPVTLSADYPIRPETAFDGPRVVAGALVLAAWIAGVALAARRAPVAAFAGAWVLVTWVPCSNVVPLTHFFVAERYLYAPSFGICLLAGHGLDRALALARSRERVGTERGVAALAVLLIVAGAARSALRVRDWRDDRALWSASLRDGIESSRIQGNLAVVLMTEGQPEASIEHFERALELHPCTKWRLPLASVLQRLGRDEEALQQCDAILDLEPKNGRARALRREIAQSRRR